MTEQKFKTEEAIKFTKTVEGKYIIGENGRVDTYNEKDNTYSVKSAGQIIIDVPSDDMEFVYQSIDKNVDEILRQRDSSKTFRDSDVRVGGARKELMAYKNLINIDDLENIEKDAVIAKSLVKKDKVYPQINTTEQIDKGVSGGTLFLKLELRRLCGQMPPDTKEFRALYVGLAEWLYQLFDDAITMDDFEWRRKLFIEGVIRKSLLIANPEIEPELIKQNEYYTEQVLKEYEYRDKKDDKKDILNKLAVEAGVSSYDLSKLKEAFPEQYKEYDYWNNLYIIADKYSSYKILPLEYKFLHSLSVNQGGKTISILTEKDISNGVYVLSDLEYLKGYTSQVKYELISSVFGDKFLNFVRKISSDTVTKIYNKAKMYEAFTLEEYNKIYENSIKPVEDDIVKYSTHISFLNDPEKTYREKVDYALAKTDIGGWYWTSNKKRTFKRMVERKDIDDAIKLMNSVISKPDSGYHQKLEENKKRLEEIKIIYRVRENNYSFLENEEKKERKQGERTDLVINSGTPLSFIKRDGGIAIYDTDLDSQDKLLKFYKDTLGITRITFGLGLGDNERMAHSRHFSTAIIDLAETLNWDVKSLTNLHSESLGIMFGAAGHGKAMAHYNSQRTAINLTRRKGDGTVAHEMAHYADNVLTRLFPNEKKSEDNHATFGSYITGSAKNISNQSIQSCYDTLMTFIKSGVLVDKKTLQIKSINKEHPVFIKIEPLLDEFVKSVISTTVSIKINSDEKNKITNKRDSIESTIEYYKQQYPHYFSYDYYLKNKSHVNKVFGSIINTFGEKDYVFNFNNNPQNKRTSSFSDDITTSTIFYLKSSALKSKYWIYDFELFARSFETYIYSKMQRNNRSNNYLVSGSSFDHDSGIYPNNIEKEIIYIMMDYLFDTIKSELRIKDFVGFRDERVDEMIILNEDDTEKRSLVVDEETSEVISSTHDDEEKIKEGTRLLEELIVMLKSGKNKLEEGGEINSNKLVESLFNFNN